jgi:hypothetical protein
MRVFDHEFLPVQGLTQKAEVNRGHDVKRVGYEFAAPSIVVVHRSIHDEVMWIQSVRTKQTKVRPACRQANPRSEAYLSTLQRRGEEATKVCEVIALCIDLKHR